MARHTQSLLTLRPAREGGEGAVLAACPVMSPVSHVRESVNSLNKTRSSLETRDMFHVATRLTVL